MLHTQTTPTRILILGVNGFIGNALSDRLLQDERFHIYGMDLQCDKIQRLLHHERFHFVEGDICINREWVEYQIRKCDVVLPLVAIATPMEYVRNPLRVFQLDFEENLNIVRHCVKYKRRIIFPSTSEVYGMCADPVFDEDTSTLVVGPIRMQRWIYSASKQLLDRVIYAYGDKEGLTFSLFRPFNWIGPRLDSLEAARIGSSRVITQFALNLVQGAPISLIDGGHQKRCFTDIRDGISGLFRIIENKNRMCDGEIFNIGNPENELSVKGLAELMVDVFEKHPLRNQFPAFAGYQDMPSLAYYGKGYQDTGHRKPSIEKAAQLLDWSPRYGLRSAIESTMDFFLKEAAGTRQ